MDAFLLVAGVVVFAALVTYIAASARLAKLRKEREKPIYIPTTVLEVKERPAFYIDVDD